MPVTTPTAELVRDNCDHRDCTAPSPPLPARAGAAQLGHGTWRWEVSRLRVIPHR